MSFFCARRSSTNASSASCTLRFIVRSGVRKKFLHSCCVMVLPPWGISLSLRMLRMTAATSRMGSRPGWLKKRRSSIASTASTTCLGSSSYWMRRRFSRVSSNR